MTSEAIASEKGPIGRLVERGLRAIRDWRELQALGPDELDRIARDLGMSGDELKDIATRGGAETGLVFARMQALGLARTDVESTGAGVMRDLERTCSCCPDKPICRVDLAEQPGSEVWKQYCPNAETLTGLTEAKVDSRG